MISLLIADESVLLVYQTKSAFCVNILVILDLFLDLSWDIFLDIFRGVFWEVFSDSYKSLCKIINRILIRNFYKTTFPYMIPV